MAAAETWKDEWRSINSKFATCESECITHYRSDQKCKDSIEAVVADIWNLKDWLAEDATITVSKAEIDEFVKKAIHITACGDIETKQKHYRVVNRRHEEAELVLKGNYDHPSGLPLVFGATRRYRDGSGRDNYEDACELPRRAIKQWRGFLQDKGLL
jgi:hypothetical protein